jgi:hypothetical protein
MTDPTQENEGDDTEEPIRDHTRFVYDGNTETSDVFTHGRVHPREHGD